MAPQGNASHAEAKHAARAFRGKLLVTLILSISAVTGIVLWLTQQSVRQSSRNSFQQKFESMIAYQQGMEQGRQTSVEARCRNLARSVRVRAALQEDDVADLYQNALADMPELQGDAGSSRSPGSLQANFVRFLNSAGALLSPEDESGRSTESAWEKELAAMGDGSLSQCRGYVSIPPAHGEPQLNVVISTPVIDANSGQQLGTMLVGFTPTLLAESETERSSDSVRSGIYIGGRLYTPPEHTASSLAGYTSAAASALSGRKAIAGQFQASIDDVPHLAFYRLLNPGSPLEPAYEVSFYSLTEALAEERRLSVRILLCGFSILLAGTLASLYLSRHLAKPVEKIAADSAASKEGMEKAEAALEMTADELRIANQDLKLAMEKLEATQQQVIQQERLRALGEMASGIAHDFNNALMPISGFSEMLLSNQANLDDRPTAIHFLEMIHTAAQDAGSVVARLREFYRPNEQCDVFGSLMLKRVVKQAASLTQPKWKEQAQARGVQVQVKVEMNDKVPVLGSESALRELLTNLIFNAVDAMPGGGTIWLRTRSDVSCGVIEVADSGTGMTPEVKRRCLEPFFSTKGERGTGLGLAMVFGIVQRHQGSVEIESEVGKGTTFIIRLPLYHGSTVAGETGRTIVSDRALNVLLVDDESQVREAVIGLLHAQGHACETASHASEALHKFRERHFDLVITDKAMPGMSGDQMGLIMKKLIPSIPIVLLTGFSCFLGEEEVQGVDVIAGKPITLASLREVIDKALKAA